MQEMEEQGLLEIAADDAAIRNITSGDPVRVFNNRGQVMLKARVNSKVQPGVVSAKLNWPKMTPGVQSINSLTSEKLTIWGIRQPFIPRWSKWNWAVRRTQLPLTLTVLDSFPSRSIGSRAFRRNFIIVL